MIKRWSMKLFSLEDSFDYEGIVAGGLQHKQITKNHAIRKK